MKILFIMWLLPIIIQATTYTELMVGSLKRDGFERSAKYSIEFGHKFRSGLSIGLGTSFYQFSTNDDLFTDIAFPMIVIKQSYAPIKKIPLQATLGAGFGLQHIDASFGTHYINTQLLAGVQYKLTKELFLIGNYVMQYGKSKQAGISHSFDGHSFNIGLGIRFPKPKKQPIIPMNLLQDKKQQRNKAPRKRNVRKPTAYEQTQKLMNELSWPTY